MRRLRHAGILTWEFGRYARVGRAWWLFLILPVIALAVFSVGAAQVAVPYTVYTLF